MTGIEALVARLEAAGVVFALEGGRVVATGPIPEDDEAMLRAERPAVEAVIAQRGETADPVRTDQPAGEAQVSPGPADAPAGTNRLILDPDDDVLVEARAGGQPRTWTRGEVRRLLENDGDEAVRRFDSGEMSAGEIRDAVFATMRERWARRSRRLRRWPSGEEV